MSERDLPALVSQQQPSPIAMGYPMIPQQYVSPGISLLQLWTIIWAYRRITLIAFGVALLLGIVLTILLPKEYESTATLMVDYEINDPLAGKEFPTSLIANYMATQIQLMESPSVLAPAVQKLGLASKKEYTDGFSGSPAMLLLWIGEKFSKKLIVEQGSWGSQLINISYTASSPQEAADAANAVADAYSDQQAQRLTGPAAQRAERQTRQIEELKAAVDAAQEKLTAYRQKIGLVEASGDPDLEMTRLVNLEGRLVDAQQQRREAEARNYGAQATRDSTLGARSIQDLRASLSGLQTKYSQLSATVGARHPEAIELQSQIDSTQRELDAEMKVYSGNAQTQVGAARELESQLQKAVDDQRAKILQMRKTLDEAAKYQLDLTTAQTLYSKALNGYDQAMMGSGSGYNNVHIVNRATPPVHSSKPKFLMKLAMVVIFCAGLGVVGPLAYELLNRRVRCADDLDRDFGVPVLMEFIPPTKSQVAS